ncbi:hypothetical protein M0805_006138 [Coniferiporia weirii]|nr:hypothetical protein M0805_006138 [Coniferiporia weirii]
MSAASRPTGQGEQSAQPALPALRIDVPNTYLVLPAACAITGLSLGLMRGARAEGWRFLAENAHRAPTTVGGWYLYKKTKNYWMMWGGLKAGGWDALRLGSVGLAWAGLQDGMQRVGLGRFRETGAGVGTTLLFVAAYRLPWLTARRVLALGVLVGGAVNVLREGRDVAASRSRARSAIAGREQ